MASNRREFLLTQKGTGTLFWILAGVGCLLIFLGIFIFAMSPVHDVPKTIAALLPAAVGAAMCYYGYWQRRRAETDRAPRLVVDSAMIHAPKTAAKPIPWTSVEKIVAVKSRYNHIKNRHEPGYLAIDVDDPKAYEPTRMAGMMAKANQMMAGWQPRHDLAQDTRAILKAAAIISRPRPCA
jgi:hypothetical protein